ncbi:hypothetical protein TPB0596_42620 [Tsukamurella pulmonis]|uniref:hypothetical protein n=1 Tax=Tsukamurella pulmonis TaxID=47312 RepID=UPI001EDE5ED5|nr:hypothetical protein [Tsukamurella pulmonis]BDD84499.1 hypothetical protein TPB0596_42620 [Tsukamurella pulmonis]
MTDSTMYRPTLRASGRLNHRQCGHEPTKEARSSCREHVYGICDERRTAMVRTGMEDPLLALYADDARRLGLDYESMSAAELRAAHQAANQAQAARAQGLDPEVMTENELREAFYRQLLHQAARRAGKNPDTMSEADLKKNWQVSNQVAAAKRLGLPYESAPQRRKAINAYKESRKSARLAG